MKWLHVFTMWLLLVGPVGAVYPEWKHTGSIYLLTTPEGANLPATASVENFPILVRLHSDFFPFKEAKANGEDLRFSTANGERLAYQIEEWDALKGVASVWVRVPRIQGNTRQEIKIHWGNADARSESRGKAVFNESNSYLSVWHMTAPVTDEVGTLVTTDTGTQPGTGVIGPARRFTGKEGLFGGDKIPSYPTGSSAHSTGAWIRAEKPNGTVIGWGNEQGQGKVVMIHRSPPHIRMDCYFSDGSVESKSTMPVAEWAHVVHTYEKGHSRIYVNGVLDGVATARSSPLAIKSPARLWIGGWYHNYSFVGDIDEVRVSTVARTADWVKLEYENQKPQQTLVGPLVQPGREFAVFPERIEVAEGKSVTLTAKAGGAQKIAWIVMRDGQETIAAVDRFSFTFDAGRVVGDQHVKVRFQAIFADGVKNKDITVHMREAIPEPEFRLQAPAAWDGRATIEVVPQVVNLDAMKAAGAGKLRYVWRVGDIATIHRAMPEKLVLNRAQSSGPLTVTLALDNGGTPTVRSASLVVTEPRKDAWVERVPEKDEKPVEGQFYARDDKNEGTLVYNGRLTNKADSVFLKVFAEDQPFSHTSQKLGSDGSYSFVVKLKPGMIKYRVEFGTVRGDDETTLHRVSNLICGDAFLIVGQSNAVATDFGKDESTFHSDWIRSFGSTSTSPKGVSGWGNAVHRSRDAGKFQVGYWGMELGRRLIEAHKIPICLINGAVGGTRIDQHQRNAVDPEDMTTIYGRLLWRVRQARLTHGIRGVLWHQGENDQGADGPTGGFGWETYRAFFIDLAAAWKQDYPNIQHYYAFQIWPKACAMGINGSDNRLREVQRTLPTAFSNLSMMSTLGIDPPGGCHFPAAGYAEFARLLAPLLERDFYGKKPTTSITPPNLIRASSSSERPDEILLEFDQPVKWNASLTSQFLVDGEKGRIASGLANGNKLSLKLMTGPAAKTLTYLDSAVWSQKTLLVGENGLAAFTFCDVPIHLPGPPPAPRDRNSGIPNSEKK